MRVVLAVEHTLKSLTGTYYKPITKITNSYQHNVDSSEFANDWGQDMWFGRSACHPITLHKTVSIPSDRRDGTGTKTTAQNIWSSSHICALDLKLQA